MARRITRGMFRNNGRAGIGHPSSWHWYHVANSLSGLWFMVAVLGKRKIDCDVRKTLDGVLVVCHWVKQADFRWLRVNGVPVNAPIESMTLAQVRNLISSDGYRITTLAEHMGFVWARKWRGVIFIIEPKHPQTFRDAAEVRAKVVAPARKFGIGLGGYTLKANARNAPIMRQAGIATKVLAK